MSRPINPTIGALGYEAFCPQKPGKIISVRKGNRLYEEYITLKFLDGSTKEFNVLHINDFNHLVEEHRKKYEKFSLIAQKLSKI